MALHQWTFLQAAFLRAFCLQMGSGAAPPPPKFLAMRAWFKEWRTINGHSVKQTFYEHSVIYAFRTRAKRLSPKHWCFSGTQRRLSRTARRIYTPSSSGFCWTDQMFFPMHWRDSGSKRRPSPPPATRPASSLFCLQNGNTSFDP